MEGLVEEENEEEEAAPIEEEEGVAVGAIALAEKKTERQRKKERAEKIKVHTLYKLAHFRWFNFKKVLVQIFSLFCFNISPIEVVVHRQVWAVTLMTKSNGVIAAVNANTEFLLIEIIPLLKTSHF